MIALPLAAILATQPQSALPAAAQTAQPVAPAPVVASTPNYAQDATWICLPDRADTCGTPLPTADLNPNGYGPVAQSRVATAAPVDCFFVYPTVSRDRTINSDLDGAEERGAAQVLLARFAGLCRTFAPMYRSVTATGLGAAMMGRDIQPAMNLAYEDVRSAWRQYLAGRNGGRPFILIGHSQGSIHLQRLIQEEIEGEPVARQMVSAVIPGWNVEVPAGGAVVGGTFRSTPLCTRIGQTGCIVTYVSFRPETPPPAQPGAGLFGRAARAGMTVACTNPATLAAGRAPLDSYWVAGSSTAAAITWSTTGAPPAPFLHTTGLASGECMHDGPVGYLAVRAEADPADARTDRIPGDVVLAGVPAPSWGLHPADIPEAQGSLMRLVEAQIHATVQPRRRR